MEIVIWNVDTQNDFMNENGALSVPGAGGIVANVESILGLAERSRIRILGSADEHTDKSAEFAKNGGQFPDHCVAGTQGQLNIGETFLGSGKVGVARWHKSYSGSELSEIFSKPQVILTKDDNDVFTSPHIYPLLKTVPNGATIYLTGVATEYCDACAIRGLVKYGSENNMEWKIVLVTDATKEITEQGKTDAFAEFKRLGISFATTSEVIRHINQVNMHSSILKDAARPVTKKTKLVQ